MRPVLTLALTLAASLVGTLPSLAAERNPMSLHEITLNTLDGKPQSLAAYKGKVVLAVNVASECGFTPQYAGLQKLYSELKDKGLVILGFPCNQFGGQEPGTAAQIETFCQKNYGVTFPLFEKLEVKGPHQAPVYAFLTAKNGEPSWNFHKYLVGKDGQVIQAFSSKVAPDSAELKAAIEAALK
ncbi:glutathione peroxidase [Geothrix sp. PMB-07]|uniref:glutathione peroxidase n=1 Tax=Geothrix sp. PMB-07 TaxID=3068640 RepID=UPI00274136AB|nr:glutathione peroxidase [Geothrix sp. PMB-07]WLT31675.1 glutathione peroxidase [Geothrix sp. PMB-07]